MEEEIDLNDLFNFFLNKKIIILLVAVIFIALSLVYTYFIITPIYSATTSLILVEMKFEDEADVSAYSKLVDRYTVVASSRKIVEKVKENLKLETSVEELDSSVWVSSNPAGYIIKITAEREDSNEAVKIANEAANVFIKEIADTYNDDKIKILDPAIENTTPINVNLIKNLAIFIVVGMIIVFGYYLLCFVFKENTKHNEYKKISK